MPPDVAYVVHNVVLDPDGTTPLLKGRLTSVHTFPTQEIRPEPQSCGGGPPGTTPCSSATAWASFALGAKLACVGSLPAREHVEICLSSAVSAGQHRNEQVSDEKDSGGKDREPKVCDGEACFGKAGGYDLRPWLQWLW